MVLYTRKKEEGNLPKPERIHQMINAVTASTRTDEAQAIKQLEAFKRTIKQMRQLNATIEDTVRFCDVTISPRIEEESAQGLDSLTLYFGILSSGSNICHQLYEENTKYANGDKSYWFKPQDLHLPTMCSYLVKNGYTVEPFKWTYKSYGLGKRHGIKLVIRWDNV